MIFAKGHFDVILTGQEDLDAPAGRMLIEKTYHGDMEGTGTGQMISKRTEKGASVYFAIEEFTGLINGKLGGLTFVHKGVMGSGGETLEIDVLDGSASGEIKSLTGRLDINVEEGRHFYELKYTL